MTGSLRPTGGTIVTEPTSEGTDSAPDFTTLMTALMPDLLAYFVRRVTPREDSADCLSETMMSSGENATPCQLLHESNAPGPSA